MFSVALKGLRKDKGFTQVQLSQIVGVDKSSVAKWETAGVVPSADILLKLSELFGVSVDYLLSNTENSVSPLREPLTAGAWVPVLGRVPAGVPVEAVEDIVDKVQLNERMTDNGHEYFALLVTGDSMFPEYKDGDIVIVRKQPAADSGRDVVAYVNGKDATLKRYIESEAGITLRALNPASETKTYSHEEAKALPVEELGVVVEQRRSR